MATAYDKQCTCDRCGLRETLVCKGDDPLKATPSGWVSIKFRADMGGQYEAQDLCPSCAASFRGWQSLEAIEILVSQ